MNIRSLLSVTVIFLIISFESVADGQLGRLIKEQKNNDSTSFQGSKVEKKYVFSEVTEKPVFDSEFPQETPCFKIDELVLENDFLNDGGKKN